MNMDEKESLNGATLKPEKQSSCDVMDGSPLFNETNQSHRIKSVSSFKNSLKQLPRTFTPNQPYYRHLENNQEVIREGSEMEIQYSEIIASP